MGNDLQLCSSIRNKLLCTVWPAWTFSAISATGVCLLDQTTWASINKPRPAPWPCWWFTVFSFLGPFLILGTWTSSDQEHPTKATVLEMLCSQLKSDRVEVTCPTKCLLLAAHLSVLIMLWLIGSCRGFFCTVVDEFVGSSEKLKHFCCTDSDYCNPGCFIDALSLTWLNFLHCLVSPAVNSNMFNSRLSVCLTEHSLSYK